MNNVILLRTINNAEDKPIPLDDFNISVYELKQLIEPTSCSFTLVHNGKIMSDRNSLIHYNLHHESIIHMIYSLHGGGNDGGSIPTRGEMVKIKKKSKQNKGSAISKRLRWITCAISKQPLVQPIVADQLGNIFNKEEIIKALIEKNMSQRFSHIKSLKDVYDVNFTFNPKYDTSKPVEDGVETDVIESPFQCPVTAQPANGQHHFSLLITCGHVLSEKGLQQIDSQNLTCFVCQKYFTKSDILPLNPDERSQEKLRSKMKLQKSTKTTSNPTEDKKDKSQLKRKLSTKNNESKSSKKPRNKDNNQGSVRNTLAVQAALERVDSNHDAKKRSSEAYKSIFAHPTTSPATTAFFTGTSRGVIK